MPQRTISRRPTPARIAHASRSGAGMHSCRNHRPCRRLFNPRPQSTSGRPRCSILRPDRIIAKPDNTLTALTVVLLFWNRRCTRRFFCSTVRFQWPPRFFLECGKIEKPLHILLWRKIRRQPAGLFYLLRVPQSALLPPRVLVGLRRTPKFGPGAKL